MSEKHLFAIFVPNLEETIEKAGVIALTDPGLIFRVRKVLRLESGEQVVFFNDQSRIIVKTMDLDKKIVRFKIIETLPQAEPQAQIHLFLGLLKKQALEDAIYFATEVGVSQITPIITEKIHKNYWSKKEKERMEKIIICAREQAKSFSPTQLNHPVNLAELKFDKKIPTILFDSSGEPFSEVQAKITKAYPSPKKINLIIGPEAGLTGIEIKNILTQNTTYCSALTQNILRAPEATLLACGLLKL